MKRERIFVDMDGVIADIFTEWVKYYNSIYNDSIRVEDIIEWDLRKIVKEEAKDTIFEIFKIKGFYRNLPVIKDSQDILRKLSDSYDVYILTDPFVKNSMEEKWEWIEKHFPFIETSKIIFTGDKSVVGTNEDWMIDDKIENITNFRGRGLLFAAPHNKDAEKLTRVNDWNEVYNLLKKDRV